MRGGESSGNAADGLAARGQPVQPAGATFAFTQSLLLSYVTGLGQSCDRELAALNYPGKPDELKTEFVGGQWRHGALYACNTAIDQVKQQCALLTNHNIRGNLSMEAFESMANYPIDEASYLPLVRALEAALPGGEEKLAAAAHSLAAKSAWTKSFMNTLWHVFDGSTLAGVMALKQWTHPSFTESNLRAACQADVAILSVASINLQLPVPESGGTPAGVAPTMAAYPRYKWEGDRFTSEIEKIGTCDHLVFLESCDETTDVYKIWSWGKYFEMTKLALLGIPVTAEGEANPTGPCNTGMICYAVTASPSFETFE
ncbi:unnamed protein product [Prorocentrum cordatum]|uniref:Uncharacterized protein n=1 Tax=Prorocentrum cordatum TaxID=2364126 RepID=A0ABN9Q5V0_9DINO|nr:unnamed protein product [Polarella glacialis]